MELPGFGGHLITGVWSLGKEARMGRVSKYPPGFRREAVALAVSSGRSVAGVARSLGISEVTLWNWVKADRERRERAGDPEALTVSEREELKKLRRRVAQQEIDSGDPGEGGRVFREGDEPVIGYRFVHDHRAEYRVTDLCRVTGVSRSGFYAWAKRCPSRRSLADQELLVEAREIHQESRRTYGSPRVHEQLRHRGRRVDRSRVARLMRANRLVEACPHRRGSGDRDTKTVPAGDLLDRDFTAEAPDRKWVADITWFGCVDTRVHLTGVLDLCNRTLVGWSIAEYQTTELVVDALAMAIARRRPGAGLVHHSDRGTQYTSMAFSDRLAQGGLLGSWGTVGDCYDIAAMEPFWATLKKEIRHIHGPWERLCHTQLRTILLDYIEVFYNRQRHHSSLGHPPGLHQPPSRMTTTIRQNNLSTKPGELQTLWAAATWLPLSNSGWIDDTTMGLFRCP